MNIKGDLGNINLELIQGNSTDEYQWLIVFIDAKLRGFTASYNISIELESFTSFLETLKKWSIDNTQEIAFTTLEDSLTLNGKYDDLGKIQWRGKLQYPIGDGNILDFKMETDVVHVESLINELEFELSNLL
ncbi:hypothetical protein [Labilibaculum manganireducens]|uniref:WapI family immunity protein n=1 Tax=Labilibaculum manganireducens TaxID=1940525 RepID=UPI0029F58879|nr:hypothetical protein [Labilibaculum manganireducens]